MMIIIRMIEGIQEVKVIINIGRMITGLTVVRRVIDSIKNVYRMVIYLIRGYIEIDQLLMIQRLGKIVLQFIDQT